MIPRLLVRHLLPIAGTAAILLLGPSAAAPARDAGGERARAAPIAPCGEVLSDRLDSGRHVEGRRSAQAHAPRAR